MPMRLAIVIGHNSAMRGAFGLPPIDRHEFEFNSVVALTMKQRASRYDIATKSFFRRARGSYLEEIREAYAEVARWRPDCVIELHFNASTTDATGSETLCRNDDRDAFALAEHILQTIGARLNLPERGVKPIPRGARGAGSLYALDGVPTVIVEPFFGSNPEDCARVAALGEHALALAYLCGARDWAVAKAEAGRSPSGLA